MSPDHKEKSKKVRKKNSTIRIEQDNDERFGQEMCTQTQSSVMNDSGISFNLRKPTILLPKDKIPEMLY